jgi:DNA-binding GntR family transcriptional regulator
MPRPAVTTAVDAVAAVLRRRILDGELGPGARLRETALSAEFDVARHTLRAALRVLAAEHLVTVEPHRGAHVTSLDGDQLQALIELRMALETGAAALLAERGALGPPWPAEVERAAQALEAACAAPEPDRAEIDEAHTALHHALVRAAGSPRITAVHAGLTAESRVILLQSRTTLPVERMAAAHRELLDRLHRDGPAALREHLREGAAAAGADGGAGAAAAVESPG